MGGDVEEVATEADAIDLDVEAGTAVVVTASLGFETDSVTFVVEDAETAGNSYLRVVS